MSRYKFFSIFILGSEFARIGREYLGLIVAKVFYICCLPHSGLYTRARARTHLVRCSFFSRPQTSQVQPPRALYFVISTPTSLLLHVSRRLHHASTSRVFTELYNSCVLRRSFACAAIFTFSLSLLLSTTTPSPLSALFFALRAANLFPRDRHYALTCLMRFEWACFG